ncbi:hypothetical protein TorRG33x02_045670 [Trema orientale]|uniref:Uncharacterized protein n=1 Tax=Trema orientale TaxID=63057 RepID=A0A2P5FPR8_TREOI|nr:hypothetical protein TorRG33x02_045670 [Trema orientale]
MRPVMVPKVGSSTPQFGAKISVKSSSDGLQFTVLLLVQLLLHDSTYCKAMQPSPGLSVNFGSLWAVRLLLIMLTMSFAGFPENVTMKARIYQKFKMLIYYHLKGNEYGSSCLTVTFILMILSF